MSAYHCELCGKLRSADTHLAYEWGEGLVCEDCHVEATPDDWEDWRVSYWKKPIPDRRHDWELTHKDYDGPDDPRAFTGPSLADVWQQAKEWAEENPDFYTQPDPDDHGDWLHDQKRDKALDRRIK